MSVLRESSKLRRGLMLWVIAPMLAIVLWLGVAPSTSSASTVARDWNEALLDAIRIDFPAPTVHARNLYHSSAAMWDAWAAYDNTTAGVFYNAVESAPDDLADARREAISYAAYRLLSQRYAQAVDPAGSQEIFDGVMDSLGYDKAVTTTVGNSPAAVGNRIAQSVLAQTLNDGSNEANGYVDTTGYAPVNDPLLLTRTGVDTPTVSNPNRWQPLAFETRFTQNGLTADEIQTFVGPHWGRVTGFALSPDPGQDPWTAHDPGPPPQLGGVGDAAFKANVVDLIRHSAVLDPDAATVPVDLDTVGLNAGDSTTINLSPSVRGNRPLGTHDDQGHPINPVTGQPYADNFVDLGDYGRVVAEFWADGPESETPPGHWFKFANEVADHPQLEKRIGGSGPVVSDLRWDVSTYLVLGGAVHDAAVAGWGSKAAYDYVRPITMVRTMGARGQCSDSNLPSYDPNGLPLVPGLIELVTSATAAPGGKHEGMVVGEIAIYAWSGEGEVPEGEVAGVDWIPADEWWPYQRATFVTPAFAAYVSGHSTFSRAAAEVLTQMTGTPYFPGGMGEYAFPADTWLEFEEGPGDPVTLQWATYFDAADEAGISRLFGGIHVAPDDFLGRIMGHEVGLAAWDHGMNFIAIPEPTAAALLALAAVARLRRPRRA